MIKIHYNPGAYKFNIFLSPNYEIDTEESATIFLDRFSPIVDYQSPSGFAGFEFEARISGESSFFQIRQHKDLEGALLWIEQTAYDEFLKCEEDEDDDCSDHIVDYDPNYRDVLDQQVIHHLRQFVSREIFSFAGVVTEEKENLIQGSKTAQMRKYNSGFNADELDLEMMEDE